MPFYGPINLGGYTPDQGIDYLKRMIPGIQGISSFAGPSGGTAALGFTHQQPGLFAGQPPSSLDALTASQPNLFEGVGAQPESVTAAISGGTTPFLGIAPGGLGEPSVGGGVVGGGASGAATSSPSVSGSPSPAFGAGFNGQTQGSPLTAAGQAALANITFGMAGKSTPAATTAGLIGGVVGTAFGFPGFGPAASALTAGLQQNSLNNTIASNPTAYGQGIANSAMASTGLSPVGLTPGDLGIANPTPDMQFQEDAQSQNLVMATPRGSNAGPQGPPSGGFSFGPNSLNAEITNDAAALGATPGGALFSGNSPVGPDAPAPAEVDVNDGQTAGGGAGGGK